MAQLDGAVPATLGALVGAATFAAGFLSTRVHRQRDQALTIATETDALADAAARAGEPIPPAVVRTQLRALDDAGNDPLDWMAGGSVVLLAGSVVALAVVTARSAGTGWSSSEGQLLIAFVVAALVVLIASMVDLVVSRRDVRRRRAASIGGLMERSDRLWAGIGAVSTEALEEGAGHRRRRGAELARHVRTGVAGPRQHPSGPARYATPAGRHVAQRPLGPRRARPHWARRLRGCGGHARTS